MTRSANKYGNKETMEKKLQEQKRETKHSKLAEASHKRDGS